MKDFEASVESGTTGQVLDVTGRLWENVINPPAKAFSNGLTRLATFEERKKAEEAIRKENNRKVVRSLQK